MKKITVSLSTGLTHLYELEDKCVVIADILRCTSCIVTALAHGAQQIRPLISTEACRQLKPMGYWLAGEQYGQKITGFDLDNSPMSYQTNDIKGKKIAMRTTNGTKAVVQASHAKQLIIGAFLNLDAVARYCVQQPHDIVMLCAGYKDNINTEDTLFAGALVTALQNHVVIADEAAFVAQLLYQKTKDNLLQHVQASPLSQLKANVSKADMHFCLLQHNMYEIVPVLKDGVLTNL